MPSPRRTRSLVAATGGVLLAVAGPASIAFAHIHPEPGEVATGTPSVVGFTIEHGCEGSPTNKVELKIPEGFSDLTPQPVDGWTASVVDGVAMWEGGSLDAETEGTFAVELTATTPGDFEIPMVQTCEVGELAWIQSEIEGQPEPDHPAPVLRVTGDAVPAEPEAHDESTGHHDAATETTAAAPADTEAEGHDEGAADSHDEAAAGDTTVPSVIAPAPAEEESGDGGSNTGAVVGGVVAAIVVLGGGGYALTKKRSSAPKV